MAKVLIVCNGPTHKYPIIFGNIADLERLAISHTLCLQCRAAIDAEISRRRTEMEEKKKNANS